ncbi:MAG: aminotransferase class I/II-fold pyridoxal phosphate-dependent enzyme, partial [Sulfuricurvum sp.]|nr:aminotransferase class I/II-fold pyridoxal phosphate-dependent enzyme [Sulfuricurvum sp.]
MKRSFIREILEVIDTDTISFAGGLPDENLFPMQAIAASAQSVLSDPKSLQYSFSAGINGLRDKLAAYYTALGLETSRDNILITTGAQQALDLISRVYFKEGTVVESPAYLGALNAFNANGCQLAQAGARDHLAKKVFHPISREQAVHERIERVRIGHHAQ